MVNSKSLEQKQKLWIFLAIAVPFLTFVEIIPTYAQLIPILTGPFPDAWFYELRSWFPYPWVGGILAWKELKDLTAKRLIANCFPTKMKTISFFIIIAIYSVCVYLCVFDCVCLCVYVFVYWCFCNWVCLLVCLCSCVSV